MKKTLVIVATVVGVVLLGNVVAASAQGIGPGAGSGPASEYMTEMHEAVWTAVAQELGLTYDELVAATQEGQTLWQIAADKGVSIERLREVMLEARETALADLVAQGVITQEQADWMLSRTNRMGGPGAGFGTCHDTPGAFAGGMMGGHGRQGGHGHSGSMHPQFNTPATSGSNG